jgi:mycofactocin precursor
MPRSVATAPSLSDSSGSGGFRGISITLMDDVEVETVEEALLEDELLVEEISIDGMCGVY